MRGRRPTPTRLKMLTGNPGKRSLNHDEPRPEANIPECPPELGPVARAEWDRLVDELAALRLLTNLDRTARNANMLMWHHIDMLFDKQIALCYFAQHHKDLHV